MAHGPVHLGRGKSTSLGCGCPSAGRAHHCPECRPQAWEQLKPTDFPLAMPPRNRFSCGSGRPEVPGQASLPKPRWCFLCTHKGVCTPYRNFQIQLVKQSGLSHTRSLACMELRYDSHYFTYIISLMLHKSLFNLQVGQLRHRLPKSLA